MFSGSTYDRAIDGPRLSTQLEAVRDLMVDGVWRTLAQIQTAIGRGSEAAISARLRDLRKDKFGSYQVDRRRRGETGLWEYRVTKHKKKQLDLWVDWRF